MSQSTEAIFLKRIDTLIAKGEAVLAAHVPDPTQSGPAWVHIGTVGYVPADLFFEWRSQASTLLTDLLGAEHPSTKTFTEQVTSNRGLAQTQAGQGVLRGLREDVANGYLTRFTTLVTAEVFTDFLDMAAHLLVNHYYYAAGAVTGAVLEDGLRRIALAKGIAFKQPGSISTLNDKLVQAGVYSQVEWRQIQVWGDVRNAIDHGRFDSSVTEDQVNDMHRGVSKFLGEHLR